MIVLQNVMQRRPKMNNLLTSGFPRTKIDSPFPHEAVGICTPYNKGQKRPLLSVVFLCPSKIINKGLFPVKSFMVGCIGRLRSAVPLYGSANLIQSASNDFALSRGGLKSYKGETAMRNHTQKLTTHVSKKSKSRFNVISKTGRSIARKVPFSTAIRLKNNQPELTIKFDSMVGVA